MYILSWYYKWEILNSVKQILMMECEQVILSFLPDFYLPKLLAKQSFYRGTLMPGHSVPRSEGMLKHKTSKENHLCQIPWTVPFCLEMEDNSRGLQRVWGKCSCKFTLVKMYSFFHNMHFIWTLWKSFHKIHGMADYIQKLAIFSCALL